MTYPLGLTSSLRRRAVKIVSEPARQMAAEGTDTARAGTFSREEKQQLYPCRACCQARK